MKIIATLLVCMVLSLGLALSAMAQEATPVTRVLITNANVFEGQNEKLAEWMDVLVEGNKIVKKGTIPSTGIPYVVVNGTIVVKDSTARPFSRPADPL